MSTNASLKGIVHPKMKIQPLSTHLYAEGGSGEILESSHHWWRSEWVAAQLHLMQAYGAPDETSKNTYLKPQNISIFCSDLSVLKPRHKKLFGKT